jgi:hypothetical protein
MAGGGQCGIQVFSYSLGRGEDGAAASVSEGEEGCREAAHRLTRRRVAWVAWHGGTWLAAGSSFGCREVEDKPEWA